MSWAARQNHIDKALLRAADKLMAMARCLEDLGEDWADPAIKMRGEAALAYEALHKVFD